MAPNEYIVTTGGNGEWDPKESARIEDLFAVLEVMRRHL